MLSLREHNHRDAALQIPPRQTVGKGRGLGLSRRATSAHGQGDLRVTVRAFPSSASPWASHSSSASDRAGPAFRSENQWMTGCRSLHRRAS